VSQLKPFLISILVLLVAAPVAQAAKFRGQTSQDRRAVVVTEEDAPVRITIFWRAACGQGAVRDDTSSVPPYDESTATFVRDRGQYTSEITDAQGRTYRFHATARVRARLVTENKWRGRFRVTGEVRRNGELVTRCDTGRLRWRATR
jgi:hypothetical protein